VEDGQAALHALKANVAACRKGSRVRVRIFKRDAIKFVDTLDAEAYDVVFADPPYGSAKLDRVVRRWMEVPFGRILSVEHAREHVLPQGGSRHDFGDTALTIYGLKPARRAPSKGGM
jgi:16S rRNA G966 N2-methylase RsmD